MSYGLSNLRAARSTYGATTANRASGFEGTRKQTLWPAGLQKAVCLFAIPVVPVQSPKKNRPWPPSGLRNWRTAAF